VRPYFVARRMGDNRDLAGLALLGILGDRQELEGPNRDISNEGIANGFITPRRGLRLPGRGLVEQLALAVNPYLPGLSGERDAVRALVTQVTDEDDVDCESLLSRIVLAAAPEASLSAIYGIWGTTYNLGREVIDEAANLAAVVDACGKAGSGGYRCIALPPLDLRAAGGLGDHHPLPAGGHHRASTGHAVWTIGSPSLR